MSDHANLLARLQRRRIDARTDDETMLEAAVALDNAHHASNKWREIYAQRTDERDLLRAELDMAKAEIVSLHEEVSSLESREVCAADHDNVDVCGYCQRDAGQEMFMRALEFARHSDECGIWCAPGSDDSGDCTCGLDAFLNQLRPEGISALEAEVAMLSGLLDANQRQECDEIKTMRASLEAAQKDAERYRWLRSEEVSTEPCYYDFWQEFEGKLCREEKLDAAIDAEISKQREYAR